MSKHVERLRETVRRLDFVAAQLRINTPSVSDLMDVADDLNRAVRRSDSAADELERLQNQEDERDG